MKILVPTAIFFISVLCAILPLFQAHAAEGVTVTPSILRLDLTQDSEIAEIIYTNNSSTTITLRLSVKNFAALEDGWKVKLIDDNTESPFQYSLSSWIHLETETLILSPGEQRTLKVFIEKDRLSPGAHYGSVIAEIQQENASGTLGLNHALASLLFVRGATGEHHKTGVIKQVSLAMNSYTFPTSATMSFNNTGNVELVPYGELSINTAQGKRVARGIVNEDSFITLPESIRKYVIPIQQTASLWPGYYTLVLSVHFDDSALVTFERTFFSLGSFSWQQILYGALFFILCIIIGIRFLRQRRS